MGGPRDCHQWLPPGMDSGETERSVRREAERHSGMSPEHHLSVATLAESVRVLSQCIPTP